MNFLLSILIVLLIVYLIGFVIVCGYVIDKNVNNFQKSYQHVNPPPESKPPKSKTKKE